MAVKLTKKAPTADTLREWARGRGIEVREHGRLSESLVEAYNKTHKIKYETEKRIPVRIVTMKVKVADKAGRNRSKVETVPVRRVREWALSNGFPELGDRGRLPRAAFDAYAMRNAAVKHTDEG
jgi:hypothetical protein